MTQILDLAGSCFKATKLNMFKNVKDCHNECTDRESQFTKMKLYRNVKSRVEKIQNPNKRMDLEADWR